MLGIDEQIEEFTVIPYAIFGRTCSIHSKYSPSFPVMINKHLFGYLCGNCITDSIELVRKKNPSVRINDNRKALYN